jgi:hypothetical protein
MSETPRTAEQLAIELSNRAFDCGGDDSSASQSRIARREAALNKAEKDVIERITTLERELAAMTSERDALVQTSGTLCPHCGWRGLRGDAGECAFCQNAKLSADLYNMTAQLAIAERQVAVLARRLGDETHQLECPRSKDCDAFKTCSDCWAAWSREQAGKEGGKG